LRTAAQIQPHLRTRLNSAEHARKNVGFFNYYNRLVDALGIAPEPDWSEHDIELT
jgi:hypothetical protein